MITGISRGLGAALFDAVHARGDRVVGIGHRFTAAQEERAAASLNFTAPMLLSNAFLAALPDGVPATVLFLSSGAAHRVIGGWAIYGATKRGGEAFFESLADQVRAAGRSAPVRVAGVNPGVMDTGIQASIRDCAAGSGYFPEADHFLRLHRYGDLADPATVARHLVSAHLSPAA